MDERAAEAPATSPRATTLTLFARFTDELLFGVIDVLKPTFRAALGLSYTQIGVLALVLQYVAAVVEPLNGLLIDVWPRRWLLAFGALAIGIATVLVGLAPTFGVLLVAYALYGSGAGPLAHTADVVLIEGNRESARQIFARATALDTVGALLGPALVTAWLWFGLDWRWLVVAIGACALPYAGALARTGFPAPPRSGPGARAGVLAAT
jgi:MFS family permease